jgi:hypothetical protein
MFLSGDNLCHRVTTKKDNGSNLRSNPEEASTKVVLHVLNILQYTNLCVVLRSPSVDTDILVLILGLLTEGKNQLFYDYGNDSNRSGTWLQDLELAEEQRTALIGLHAFTGKHFVSSFFRKGKNHAGLR